MDVILAGYNVDSSIPGLEREAATPETLSAAYARISRDPRPVTELRKSAREEVEKARRSNRTIVFEYGHGSVAEHAVFNLDVLGVSRLATEALQSFRLASFTEKSQRYVLLHRDWIVPEELPDSEATAFRGYLECLFGSYEKIYELLLESGRDEARAREDARYCLPLAATCQMGVTMNAREVEHAVRRLSAHPLAEVRELARRMFEQCSSIAPSLFLFTEPTAVDRFALERTPCGADHGDVALYSGSDDSEIGSYLLSRRTGRSQSYCRNQWEEAGDEARAGVFGEALEGLRLHDTLPRCWELAVFRFELRLSSSAFAQLKRHRMATLLPCSYSADLGVTTPPCIMAH
ncbi:FAD-dependent thymidylate synthase, partial [Candidatus Fermentibacterales bacterium]|nr:FAD-dependent thymidylate synthase [Candidatus Fermentibacterales bacterium]